MGSHLPPRLWAAVTFMYDIGARVGETRMVLWFQVNLAERKITFTEHDTKNKQRRVVPLTDEVVALLKAHEETKTKTWYPAFDTKGLRDQWERATKEAGLPAAKIHDLRRSAVRNMVRRGVNETVAMRISGHKTRYVFDRYDVTSEEDLHEAARKIDKGGSSEV